MQIWFDMDGTLADLYGIQNWLPMLLASDPTPYREAKPLLRMATLARVLNRLARNGHEIGIISWVSKDSTAEYAEAVAQAKREWLARHLPSVRFAHIDITAYGEPKRTGRDGILFDDEAKNRADWGKGAHDATEILEVLGGLLKC